MIIYFDKIDLFIKRVYCMLKTKTKKEKSSRLLSRLKRHKLLIIFQKKNDDEIGRKYSTNEDDYLNDLSVMMKKIIYKYWKKNYLITMMKMIHRNQNRLIF